MCFSEVLVHAQGYIVRVCYLSKDKPFHLIGDKPDPFPLNEKNLIQFSYFPPIMTRGTMLLWLSRNLHHNTGCFDLLSSLLSKHFWRKHSRPSSIAKPSGKFHSPNYSGAAWPADWLKPKFDSLGRPLGVPQRPQRHHLIHVHVDHVSLVLLIIKASNQKSFTKSDHAE